MPKEASSPSSSKTGFDGLPELGLFEHLFCIITLFLISGGLYHLLMIGFPVLLYYIFFQRSYIAGTILAIIIGAGVAPLDHRPSPAFLKMWCWRAWRRYFGITYDVSSVDLSKGMHTFYEFPHGIFPMGQFISAGMVEEMFGRHVVCGTAADVIFKFPFMRQLMAWIGTRPVRRESFTKILAAGHHCAVVPGGIAEMYTITTTAETIFFKSRIKSVELSIINGTHIIPTFFFGNTKLFTVPDRNNSGWLSKISRSMRTSFVIFWGRLGLAIPYRHHIHMQTGAVVYVEKEDAPSEATVKEVMAKVEASVVELYNTKRPVWETRPLVIE
jgi:hypothetical protein